MIDASIPAKAAVDYVPQPVNAAADVIEMLPVEAAAILASLRNRHDDLLDAVRRHSDNLAELRSDRTMVVNRIKQLRASAMEHGYSLREDDPLVVAERTKETALTKQIDDVVAKQKARSDLRVPIGRLIDAIERYVRDEVTHGRPLQMHAPVEPKLHKNESPSTAIERMRQQLGELRRELQALEQRPVTFEVARERMCRELDELTHRGKPDLRFLAQPERSQDRMARANPEVVGVCVIWPRPSRRCLAVSLMED
jgi:uncharacterized coiled-coil DUF342 family protein